MHICDVSHGNISDSTTQIYLTKNYHAKHYNYLPVNTVFYVQKRKQDEVNLAAVLFHTSITGFNFSTYKVCLYF